MVRRDVVAEPIPHIVDQTILGYYSPAEQLTPELRAATALSDRLIAELQSADILLLTVPMYNFSVPSALKRSPRRHRINHGRKPPRTAIPSKFSVTLMTES